MVVGASVVFIILWVFVIVPKYLTPPARPQATNTVATVQSNLPAGTAPATPPALTAATNVAAPVAAPPATEVTLTVTNAEARYTFTSHGGGLKQVELLQYPETSGRDRKQLAGRVATLNTKAPVPVMALLGDPALQGDGVFALSRVPNGDGVRAEKELGNGLVVVKEFRPGSNHLFKVSTRIENRSDRPLNLAPYQWVAGTATPVSAVPSSSDRPGIMWCDPAGKTEDITQAWFENRTLGCFPGTPRDEYRAGTSNVTWIAAHNQFFAIVAMAPTNAPQVVAHSVKLPAASPDDLPPNSSVPPAPHGVQAVFQYPGASLEAGGVIEREFTFYAGPKKYTQLADIGERLNNHLDKVMGFGFWGIVSKMLLIAMNWLHDRLTLSYALTIIVITIIIKLAFWPLTAASTRSMKRMAALQPQMKALQEKYKDDPAKLNQKMMAFWKEHKVNPMGGCLPMIIQIPVFFGFFTMIQSAVELRGAAFLWCPDLSQSDTIFYIAGFPVNPLPLIMGATMLWQARLTPPSPGMDPMQQKIMKYMPLMFMVFLYTYSAALTLYWTTNNLLTILQTKLTKTKDPATTAAVPAPAAKPVKRK